MVGISIPAWAMLLRSKSHVVASTQPRDQEHIPQPDAQHITRSQRPRPRHPECCLGLDLIEQRAVDSPESSRESDKIAIGIPSDPVFDERWPVASHPLQE